ncbi:MAG: hypothetical protein WC223_00535 [Bacteroidales bacterium]|jgi:hypothetical protein
MKKIITMLATGILTFAANAQKNDTTIYNYGLGFEQGKVDASKFTKVKANIGGDFVLRFQSLKSHADSAMVPLGGNINFPSANLNVNVDMAPGIMVNLTTYLASRHHQNTYVEGGYILIDQLPFLKSKVADDIMKYATIKVGMMEINYGDAHFRRSDNARTLNNAFVGNYILDGFAISPALELYFRHKGILVMGGLTNCVTNPNTGGYIAAGTSKYTAPSTKYPASYTAYNLNKILGYYFKLSYDKQINKDIRIRPSISGFICNFTPAGALYNSDRAGSPYNEVMNKKSLGLSSYDATANVTNGYFGTGNYSKDNSYMFNLFAQFYGFEIFGTYEQAKGNTGLSQTFNVVPYTIINNSLEGLYYFGKHRQFDVGVRYTAVRKSAIPAYGTFDDVKGTYAVPAIAAMQTGRLQATLGWRLTNNIMTKIEYCKQTYSNFLTYGTGATPFFEGVIAEAAISF